MNEQIYTIPVNDAFDKNTECPICEMYRELERKAVEFTMGPSYMEDDVRMETNKVGFCGEHVKMLYGMQNRLGLALMLHTHTRNIIKETEKLQKKGRTSSGGLFKKSEASAVSAYMRQLKDGCYICNRIAPSFERQLDTVFWLYKREEDFRRKFDNCKGFCNTHYGVLYDMAPKYFSGSELEAFTKLIDRLYLDNLKRVCDDIEWYTDKFDYRNADAPWKNSKDAVIRTVLKVNSEEIKL